MSEHVIKLIRLIQIQNPDAILFAGFEAALTNIGYIAHNPPIAVYSKTKLLEELRKKNFTDEDAGEYVAKHFGNICAGQHTPVIIDDTIKE